ncbi:uncharacterized protein LOC115630016 isoform X6 [Scaptodrosophila lebanonensis]|uniref:Uncharacterized protein LOC115630016 isoform X6 n=1 Tax=Drosophila lebanonensis TaxID=7225 RepID=A0A6J2U299_DROLE|nr:uncharacterized protein LOC115630016 isoform X6 [Scaptodrosophila lebanonensis]
MSHIKDTELKSFKNRSGSKKLGVASCPSNISTRSLPNQIPGTKVFIDSIERKTEGDRSKPKLGRPRMNLVTQQRMNRLKALSPEKMIKCKATTPLQLYQKQHKSRSLSQSALTQKQNCCTRGLESNRVRALESQHKKLQYLQSDFMNKLRMLGPLDLCKLRGRYKFVTLVINGECKLVVHEDDLLRLPKNLPIESVNDLKERCRTVVESGFMLLYEHMSHIQLAKNEMEAQIIREQISQKLKASDIVIRDNASAIWLSFPLRYSTVTSYSSKSSLIRVSFELGLVIENNELQIQLKGNEYKLDSQPPIAQKLQEQLRKADIQIAHLQEQAERDRQVLAVRCEMINAMQQHEHDNRNKLDELYYQISEKNTLISQINNHLFLKNEEFLNLFGTLSSKQMEVRRAEHIIKLLEENNVRTSLLRIKQEERNALMQDEIAHLKRTIRSYAKIIIGNNGRNIFEVVPADQESSSTFYNGIPLN